MKYINNVNIEDIKVGQEITFHLMLYSNENLNQEKTGIVYKINKEYNSVSIKWEDGFINKYANIPVSEIRYIKKGSNKEENLTIPVILKGLLNQMKNNIKYNIALEK